MIYGIAMSDASHLSGSVVDVFIENTDGVLVHQFQGKEHKSFVQMAEDVGIELPVSCCSGACFVCACRIKDGIDNVDIAKLSVPLVDIDEDQVLSCIGGIKSSCFRDGKYHKIVLQKML